MLIHSTMNLASTPYLKSARVPGLILDKRIKQMRQKRKLQRKSSGRFYKTKRSTNYVRRNYSKKQNRDTR